MQVEQSYQASSLASQSNSTQFALRKFQLTRRSPDPTASAPVP